VKARATATASVEIRAFMTFSLYAYNTAELQPEENARSSLLFPSPNKKPGCAWRRTGLPCFGRKRPQEARPEAVPRTQVRRFRHFRAEDSTLVTHYCFQQRNFGRRKPIKKSLIVAWRSLLRSRELCAVHQGQLPAIP
jgi:hypothetical protein